MSRFKSMLFVVMLVVARLIISSGPVVEAQGPDLLTISYVRAEQVPYRTVVDVNAYVSVSQSNGNPVAGLSAQDFTVVQDGREMALMSAEPTNEPISVVLVIDTSRSMSATDSTGRAAMESAKDAARGFVDALNEEDRVAVYSFDREANLLQDLSMDHGAAINAIYTIEFSENRTCLYDAAMIALAKASEAPKGRRAVVLFTDGKDEVVLSTGQTEPASTHTFADVTDTATSPTRRIPIYTVGLASGQINVQELARMASLTGGQTFVANRPQDLPEQFQRIAEQMHSQYQLRYQTDAPSGDHSIVVKLNRADSPMDERLFYIPVRDLPTAPVVRISSPVPGAVISAPATVKLDITGIERVNKVSYFVDDILVGEVTRSPFDTFLLSPGVLDPGKQELRVELTDLDNRTVSAKTTLSGPVPTATDTPVPPTPMATPVPPTPTETPNLTATRTALETEMARNVEATSAARALLTAQAQQTAAAIAATAEAEQARVDALTATAEAKSSAESATAIAREEKMAADRIATAQATETASAATATARAEQTMAAKTAAAQANQTVSAENTAAAITATSQAERAAFAATLTRQAEQAEATATALTATSEAAQTATAQMATIQANQTSVAETATAQAVATADSRTATAAAILTLTAAVTPTPTPSATPVPSFVEGMTQTLQEGNPPNYVFAGIFLLLLIAGIALIVMGVLRKGNTDDDGIIDNSLIGGDIDSRYFKSQLNTDYTPGEDSAATGDVEVGDMTEDVMPLATLIVEKSLELKPGHRFQLTRSTTRIGRSSQNDIEIPDKPVSREHAEIEYDGETFWIRDVGGRFGTKVNRQDVPSRGMPLHDGAIIQLGTRTTFRFEWESDETTDISDAVPDEEEDLNTQDFKRE